MPLTLREAETRMCHLEFRRVAGPARAGAGKYWFCVKKLLESWMC